MGDSITDVDTSKFRLATWNYIHLVYGIFHDDYVYYEVNIQVKQKDCCAGGEVVKKRRSVFIYEQTIFYLTNLNIDQFK